MRARPAVLPVTACGIAILRAALFPLCAAEPAPAASPAPVAPYTQRESAWWIIGGGSLAQNAAVAETADRHVAQLESAGFSPALLHGRKVVVRLIPALPAPRLYSGAGETVLDLPADLAARDARAVAQELARAVCSRLARANHGEGSPAPWLVAAMAEESLRAGYASELEGLAREAAAAGPGTPERLDSPAATDDPVVRREAYWFYRAVRREVRESDRAALIAAAMCGVSAREVSQRVLPGAVSADARELWWPVAFYRATTERADALGGPDAARERLARLSRFVVADASGVDRVADASALIGLREREAVREVLRERVRLLKFDLPRVNPLWTNAYIAQGLFWEKLADPKTDAAVLAGLAAEAAAEIRAATALTGEAHRALAGR